LLHVGRVVDVREGLRGARQAWGADRRRDFKEKVGGRLQKGGAKGKTEKKEESTTRMMIAAVTRASTTSIKPMVLFPPGADSKHLTLPSSRPIIAQNARTAPKGERVELSWSRYLGS
jgi:hypothetical protein